MKILWISPIPSHPANNDDRGFLAELGAELMREGHEIQFMLAGSSGIATADLRQMRGFWTSFRYAPVTIPQSSSLETFADHCLAAVRARLKETDFDACICNYAFMSEVFKSLSEKPVKIILPFLDRRNGSRDFWFWRQKEWFEKLPDENRQKLFAGTDIVLTASDAALPSPGYDCIAVSLDEPGAAISDAARSVASRLLDALKNKRKRVLALIGHPFWNVKLGGLAYGFSIYVNYLRKKFRVKVYYSVGIAPSERQSAADAGYADILDCAPDYAAPPPYERNMYKAFANYLHASARFDAVIINYSFYHSYLDQFDYPVRSILFTHDFWSLREYVFAGESFLKTTLGQETAIFDKFDVSVFVEKRESEIAANTTAKTICISAPVAVDTSPLPLPEKELHFGLIVPNASWTLMPALWFLREIWPFQTRKDAFLHIFGDGCTELGELPDNVIAHGVVPDPEQTFGTFHIMINAALRASGMSTKSVQALGYGRPLLTTPEGARGLAARTGSGIYVARSRAEFVEGMLRFSYDTVMREQFSREAALFAAEHLNPERSYDPMARLI